MTSRAPAWAEIIQLIPVVSLALPFIVSGEVDLAHAGWGFAVAAPMGVAATLVVRGWGYQPNPITVGTTLWLCVGALGFCLPVEPLRAWYAQTQAFGLFVSILAVGLALAMVSPADFLAAGAIEARWARMASALLLSFCIAGVVWAWFYRHDVRLGGGLPFIVLNVTRRVLGVLTYRLTRADTHAPSIVCARVSGHDSSSSHSG